MADYMDVRNMSLALHKKGYSGQGGFGFFSLGIEDSMHNWSPYRYVVPGLKPRFWCRDSNHSLLFIMKVGLCSCVKI